MIGGKKKLFGIILSERKGALHRRAAFLPCQEEKIVEGEGCGKEGELALRLGDVAEL